MCACVHIQAVIEGVLVLRWLKLWVLIVALVLPCSHLLSSITVQWPCSLNSNYCPEQGIFKFKVLENTDDSKVHRGLRVRYISSLLSVCLNCVAGCRESIILLEQ